MNLVLRLLFNSLFVSDGDRKSGPRAATEKDQPSACLLDMLTSRLASELRRGSEHL